MISAVDTASSMCALSKQKQQKAVCLWYLRAILLSGLLLMATWSRSIFQQKLQGIYTFRKLLTCTIRIVVCAIFDTLAIFAYPVENR